MPFADGATGIAQIGQRLSHGGKFFGDGIVVGNRLPVKPRSVHPRSSTLIKSTLGFGEVVEVIVREGCSYLLKNVEIGHPVCQFELVKSIFFASFHGRPKYQLH